MLGIRDVKLDVDRPIRLLLKQHVDYLRNKAIDEHMSCDYLKMSGMYWVINALDIVNEDVDDEQVQKSLHFIKNCQNDDGGFGAAPGHDSHLLHTLSAVQILVILNRLLPENIDNEKCVNYVRNLQQKDGSFFGDRWGEVDTRFSMCALATLRLLNRLESIDIDQAVSFVIDCSNSIDGGFGSKPGSESHAAYVYCCLGSLAIAGRLDLVDGDRLGNWLFERQLPSGGLNGRPEKLPDLCYSWWCLSSMKMINKMDLINHEKLSMYILACQDEEQGGMSDRPGNYVDPYHTVFGFAALSLICESSRFDISKLGISNQTFKAVDPTFCMSREVLKRAGVT